MVVIHHLGPMLLFQRSSDKGKKFFACSACRDRKLCQAYILQTDWEKDLSKGPKEQKESQLLFRSRQLNNVRESVVEKHVSSPEDRNFCHSCLELFSENKLQHLNHKITKGVSDVLLQKPSQVISVVNFFL